MICFEVTINGKKECTAGFEDVGGIAAILSYFKRQPQPDTENSNESQIDEPHLSISGLINGSHVDWLNNTLEIGDEVTIRIIESDKADTPTEGYKEDPEESKRQRREFYEKCKLEFENE